MTALIGLVLLQAAVLAGPVCVDSDVEPGSADRLVAMAVEVLRQSGHEPGSYSVVLRAEDPFDRVALLGRRPVPGVVFEPRANAPRRDEYRLRVSSLHPCVVAWAPAAGRLTARQMEVLDGARGLLGGSVAADEILQVLESGEHFRVEVWQVPDGAGEPARTGREVTFRKADLQPVYNQRDAKPDPRGGP